MFLPKPSEGGNFEPAPAGTFIATCYRFIDLGTQVSEFNGEKKRRHEVILTWEIADEMMSDGRPFSASKTYTWSMHEKAALRKDLEAWRGRAFTAEDFDGPSAFNVKKLLGVPCMLTITHSSKDGKTYANVASVGKLFKGATPPPLVNESKYLALTEEDWTPEVYVSLSDYLKKKIAMSPEYLELQSNHHQHDDPGVRDYEMAGEDIPF